MIINVLSIHSSGINLKKTKQNSAFKRKTLLGSSRLKFVTGPRRPLPSEGFNRGRTSKAKWKNLVKQTAGHTDTQAKFSTFFCRF